MSVPVPEQHAVLCADVPSAVRTAVRSAVMSSGCSQDARSSATAEGWTVACRASIPLGAREMALECQVLTDGGDRWVIGFRDYIGGGKGQIVDGALREIREEFRGSPAHVRAEARWHTVPGRGLFSRPRWTKSAYGQQLSRQTEHLNRTGERAAFDWAADFGEHVGSEAIRLCEHHQDHGTFEGFAPMEYER